MSEPTHDPQTSAPAATPPESGEGLRLRLSLFEGPLDLLLHLVRSNDMDIFDIPIVEVAVQYDAYLELMHELDLDVAGEYLVMAATLAHIKSRMLLPPEPSEDGEKAEDPRAELTRQLLEYERLKQAAENLSALESVRSLVFTRPDGPLAEFRGEATLEVGLFDLMEAFRRVLTGLDEERRRHIHREEYSVNEKVAWLSTVLERDGARWFVPLIAGFPARGERIATFLAILELVRLRRVVALQNGPRGDIYLSLTGAAAPPAPPAAPSVVADP